MPGSISLRPAAPTDEDGRAFARYLDQAAEGFFGFLLGKRAEQILARAFLTPEHDLSYENVTFAEQDGQTVGMVSGYTAEQHRRSSHKPLTDAAGFNLRMAVVGLVLTPLFRVLDSLPDGDFYIQSLAVDPELRGQGVGSTLLDFIEDAAQKSGSQRIALDVSGSNTGAKKLYERRGMHAETSWPRRLKIPGFRLIRMVRALD